MEPQVSLPPTAVTGLAGVFKLLGDETRLRILYLLRESDEMNVLQLCRRLELRQPSVSHHLALLRGAGLISVRRDGKHNFYRIHRGLFDNVAASVAELSSADEASKLSRVESH